MDLINGVPRDQYGVHCVHGHHVLVADPNSTSGFLPAVVFADPWPCADGCTPEALAEANEAEQREYEEWLWAEYRASQ